MRFMLTFRIPMEEGNALVKDHSMQQTMETILDELQPEAAYFTTMQGARGGYLIVNMDDASQMPAIAEPLFLAVGATVQFDPVMTPEDLRNATETLRQAGQKHG